MEPSWQFSECLTTLREYQSLLNNLNLTVLSAAGALFFVNRRSKRMLPLAFAAGAFLCGTINMFLSFKFRSSLVDLILNLGLKTGGSSISDPHLRCLTVSQIVITILAVVCISTSAINTPGQPK